MIKDILVTLPTGDAPSIALDYAVTVASNFRCAPHRRCICARPGRHERCLMVQRRLCWIDYRREVEAAAEAAKVRFEEDRQREGLSAESMVLTAAAVGIPELLARTARRFDLTILPQADPEGEGSEKAMIEAVLLGSGRPILIVPYFQEGGVKFDRVLVCWDGSHNAARAIADAMPFLTRAKQVEVITVVPDEKADDSMRRIIYCASSFSARCNCRSQKYCRPWPRRVAQDSLSCGTAIGRFDCNGWLWSFAASRVHFGWRDARHARLDQCSNPGVTLNRSPVTLVAMI